MVLVLCSSLGLLTFSYGLQFSFKKQVLLKGVAFINFKNEEESQKAVEALNGRTWKNRVLGAKSAQLAQTHSTRKRGRWKVRLFGLILKRLKH